jgi:prephenate dehydrogenase
VTEGIQNHLDEDLDAITLPNPLELIGTEFSRVTIIGVGLIGGSIGLRIKSLASSCIVTGYDMPEVLDEALERGAIDRGAGDLSEAVAEADLIAICLPIDEIAKLLPTVMRVAKTGAIITDTAPTKMPLMKIANDVNNARGEYIGGHPMAGGTRPGIANAEPHLFENAYWLLTPSERVRSAPRESLSWWVRMLGAYPIVMEPELHDRVMAATTHLPFILAVSLSAWAASQSATVPVLPRLCTGYFQSMTSMASLPLASWEGALRHNHEEILAALDSFRAMLEICSKDVREGRLVELWQQAHIFQRKLSREQPGDWDSNSDLVITMPDRPGAIAKIAGLLAAHDIGIRDIHVIHVRERRGGSLKVVLESRNDARRALEILTMNGFSARMRD